MTELNLQGLAALAGNSASGFKLPEVSNAPTQAATAVMNANANLFQQAMVNKAALAKQNMENQGLFHNTQLQGQNAQALQDTSQLFQGSQNAQDRAIVQQQANQQGQLYQNQNANQQYQNQTDRAKALSTIAGEQQNQQFAAQQQPLVQTQMKQELMQKDLANTMAMNGVKIKNMGAIGSVLQLQLYAAQGNPEAQQQAIANAKKEAENLGMDPSTISSDPAQAITQAQYATHLAYAGQSGKNAGGSGQNGIIIAPGPNGTQQAFQPLNETNQGAAQQKLQSNQTIQSSLDKFNKDWQPVYNTYQGATQGVIGSIESKIGMGPTNSTDFESKMVTAKQDLSQLILSSASTMKGGRNPLVRQALSQFMPSPTDSPDAIEVKRQGVQDFLNTSNQQASQQSILGVPVQIPQQGNAGALPSQGNQ